MKLKKAALLALIGTILATVFLALTFIMTTIRVLRGLAPLVMLFPWFAYAFACLSVAVFFYVFHRDSRDFGKSCPNSIVSAGVSALSGPISLRRAADAAYALVQCRYLDSCFRAFV